MFILGSNGTNICGPGKVECYQDADGDAFKSFVLPSCNCLQSCTVLKYIVKLSQTAYDFDQSEIKKSGKEKYVNSTEFVI